MAQGNVLNSLTGLVWFFTARCMLTVCAASRLVSRLITESRLWVFTSNRTGPLGEAPTLGMKAKLPRMAMLFNWLGYAPVGKMKFAGLLGSPGGIRASASPVA